MKTLYRFAWVSTIATYVLIFTGGLVRVSGSGLGCPDWPQCFGRWLPPTSADQLPAHFDASQFNFTLAWIEYGNRMIGVVVGLLITVTAVLALVHARRHMRIPIAAVLAMLLTGFVGWQGSVVVASGLEPVIVSVHLLLSFLILCVLLYTTQQTAYILHPDEERRAHYPGIGVGHMGFLFAVALVQSALGAQLRGALKSVRDAEPLGGMSAWVDAVGPLLHIHEALGFALAFGGIFVGWKLMRQSGLASAVVRQGAPGLLVLSVAQVVFGLAMLIFGTLPILQVFHMWTSSLMVGVLLLLLFAIRQNKVVHHVTA